MKYAFYTSWSQMAIQNKTKNNKNSAATLTNEMNIKIRIKNKRKERASRKRMRDECYNYLSIFMRVWTLIIPI